MVKTIKNIDWIKLVLENHQQHVVEIGDQRNPTKVTVCKCQGYNFPPTGFKYTDHILDVIQREFPGIFEYDEPPTISQLNREIDKEISRLRGEDI